MALLPAFIRAPRAPRPASRPAADPAAGFEAVLDAPDDRLSPALVAAGGGGFGPAAALLEATRRTDSWDDRDRYVRRLAAFARSRPEWFEAWRAAEPAGPGARVVEAQLAVDRAWASPARAELLREVSPQITAAARADGLDPVPWRIALDHARGSRAGHRYFEELWEAAVRRAPHHYGCHEAALRYLAALWHGSHAECFDFADRAAQDAPPDSLVQALPARAALGYLTDGCGPDVPAGRLHLAADRALALSALVPAEAAGPAEIRNALVFLLIRLGRREEAVNQLALIGPYATSAPWDRCSDDPLGHFLRVRDALLAGASPAALAALTATPPRPRSGHRDRVGAADR
uniref:hypothetical protein n=1 Tax=Streptomyces corallincola TaxID=2851888 RepID=UPI003557D59D